MTSRRNQGLESLPGVLVAFFLLAVLVFAGLPGETTAAPPFLITIATSGRFFPRTASIAMARMATNGRPTCDWTCATRRSKPERSCPLNQARAS